VPKTTTPKPQEHVDYNTYRADDTNTSGWNWYCMHCNEPDSHGFRFKRVEARKDARRHVIGVGHLNEERR